MLAVIALLGTMLAGCAQEPEVPANPEPTPEDTVLVKVGDTAPGFSLAGTDLKDVSLADYAGKRKVLNIVPSLDTPVCATSVVTSMPRFSRCWATIPAVRNSRLESSGCWWMVRRIFRIHSISSASGWNFD